MPKVRSDPGSPEPDDAASASGEQPPATEADGPATTSWSSPRRGPPAAAGGPGPRQPIEAIGPYRLLEVIGEGGMGSVYLAEQAEPVERRVAVKLVRTSLTGQRTRIRFEAERRALARLTHPNVARLYEAGTTADGQPYFAMEYVEGPPITDYCQHHRLPVVRRLELFVAACRGVQHAHQRQLLHRDLKPNNVLVAEVDGTPVPKIIDFGIAKALDGSLTDETQLTGDRLVGTPQYMSPEALQPTDEGYDLDTRSDVYSLGVMLYELLTGVRPFTDRTSDLPSLVRAIAEDDPPPPSARVESLERESRSGNVATRLRRPQEPAGDLAGDLDWVVMKALAKERGRRYGSAGELADDVERFLRHEPVLARPPSFGYRLAKLVRRHRLVASLVALTAAALVVTAAASTLALLRVRRAEEQARQEAAASRQALDFVVGLFAAAAPEAARGEEVTARQLLDRGADRIHGEELPPLVRARWLHTLADVYGRLGQYEPARQLAAEALAQREEVLPADHPDVIGTVELLGNLGRKAGDFAAAAPLLERAVAVYEAQPESDPAALADMLNSLGNLRWRQDRLPEAVELHRRALALRQRALGPDDAEVATSHNNLGALLCVERRYAEAEPHLRRALELFEASHGPDHPRVASALTNLGIVFQRMGRYAESEALGRRALAIQEKVLGPDHPSTSATLTNLAVVYSKTGRYEEAVDAYLRALDIRRRTLGEEHVETLVTWSNLGLAYWRMGRLAEAEAVHRRVIEGRSASLGDGNPAVDRSRLNLAIALRDQGRLEAARELLEQVLESQRAAFGDAHSGLAPTRFHLGVLAARERRPAEAEEHLRAALELHRAAAVADPLLLAGVLHELGVLCRNTGRPAEAAEHLQRALELRGAALPAGHRDLRETEAALAALDAG